MLHRMKNILLLSTVLLFLSAMQLLHTCHHSLKTEAMKNEGPIQAVCTERLFTVVYLAPREGGQKVQVTFFETPQVFELSIKGVKNEQDYKLLMEAKEKKVPLNVCIGEGQEGNTIRTVRSATPEQSTEYFKQKNERRAAKPVPKPN